MTKSHTLTVTMAKKKANKAYVKNDKKVVFFLYIDYQLSMYELQDINREPFYKHISYI